MIQPSALVICKIWTKYIVKYLLGVNFDSRSFQFFSWGLRKPQKRPPITNRWVPANLLYLNLTSLVLYWHNKICFLNNLFLTIKLFIATIYNDVQIRWVFTFYQSCHGSQVRKLVFARPSGLNGVGEEVKLVSLG